MKNYLYILCAFLLAFAGLKTGVTLLAGPSFAGAANKDGRELYAIVINSSSEAQRFKDAESLCEWVYQHEISYQLANSPETATMNGTEVPVVAEVAHSGWIDKTVKATLRDPAAAVTIFDLNGNVSQSIVHNVQRTYFFFIECLYKYSCKFKQFYRHNG